MRLQTSGKFLTTAFGCFLLVMSVGCSNNRLLTSTKTDVYKPKPVVQSFAGVQQSSDFMSYFSEIAFGSEYGFGDVTLKKWEDDIRLQVIGSPNREDLQTLLQVVADLNEMIEPAVHISLVPSGGNATVYFIPHSEFYQYELPGVLFFGGFFRNWWDADGTIKRGIVVIGTDKIDQKLRNHLIREEVTQMLGLMNDSPRYPESIFYQGQTTPTALSPIDKELIRFLYQPEIKPGMAFSQLREIFDNQYAKN